MAIIKGNYTKSSAKIKASLRYIAHRPGREGERMTRVLFGHDGEMSKEQAYQLIDSQKATYFRLVLNFDPKREDTRRDLDLRSITKQTILTLEDRLQREVGFIAVEHNDHTPLRHIHAIALVKLTYREKLTREDFKALRQTATEAALFQRRARDLVQHYQWDKNSLQRSIAPLSPSYRLSGVAGGKARHTRKAKQPTIACPNGLRHETVKLKNGKSYCRSCEQVLEQSQGLSL